MAAQLVQDADAATKAAEDPHPAVAVATAAQNMTARVLPAAMAAAKAAAKRLGDERWRARRDKQHAENEAAIAAAKTGSESEDEYDGLDHPNPNPYSLSGLRF